MNETRPVLVSIAVTSAMFTDGLLYGVVIPLLPHSPAHVSEAWALSAIYSGYAIGVIAATPILGPLADRVGRRKPMLWGIAAQLAAVGLFLFANAFPALMLARVLQGAAAAATWTAGLALIAEHFHEHRAKMMGLVMLGNTWGLVLGPVAGGFLLRARGFRFPLYLTASLLLADGCLRWFLVPRSRPAGKSRSELLPLLHDRTVLAASFVVILGAWCWSTLEPLYPGYLERTAGASPAVVGTLFTISSLLYGFSCPVVGALADRLGKWRIMTLGLVLMAVALSLLTVPKTVIGGGIALTLVSVTYALAMNPSLSELGDAVDRRGTGAYGSVYAIYNITYSIGMVGSSVASGALSSTFSFQTAVLLTGAAILLCLPITSLLRPRAGQGASP